MARPTINSYSNRPYADPAYSLPNTVGTILNWFRADSITKSDGTDETDGASISIWKDEMGGDYAVSAGIADPTFNLNQLNGYPSLAFDGTDAYMSCGKVITPSTIISVFKSNEALYGDFDAVMSGKIGDTAHEGLMVTGSTTLVRFTKADTYIDGNTIETHELAPTTNWHIVIWVDVASPGTWTTGSYIGQDRTTTSRRWNGDIAEIITMAEPLTANNDRQVVFNYLNNKYQVY